MPPQLIRPSFFAAMPNCASVNKSQDAEGVEAIQDFRVKNFGWWFVFFEGSREELIGSRWVINYRLAFDRRG